MPNNLLLANYLHLTKSSHISRPSRTLYNMHMSHIYCTEIFTLAISFSVRNCELRISHRCPLNFFSHLTISPHGLYYINLPNIYAVCRLQQAISTHWP